MTKPRFFNRELSRRGRWVLNVIDRGIIASIAYGALVTMAMLISADALSRYILNDSLTFAPKVVTGLLMPIVIFGSLSHVTLTQGHVKVDILTQHFSDKFVRWLDCAWRSVMLAIFVLIAYQSLIRAQAGWGRQTIGAFDIPDFVSLSIVGIGCGWVAVTVLFGLLAEIGRDGNPSENDKGRAQPVDDWNGLP